MGKVVAFRGLPMPRTRAECQDAARPCPHRRCLHHLAPDSADKRSAVRSLEMLPETCALDVAERGGATLEEVGEILGVTRERIRQIEAKALKKMVVRARAMKVDLQEFFEEVAPEAWRGVGP